MEIIFELPSIGNLTLEHTFYMYEEPILFVCKDDVGNRYLCSCCRLSEKWVVVQVEETELIQLIKDQITIREIFESCTKTKFLITWDEQNYELNADVPSELLPKEGAMLELDYEKDGGYYSILKRSAEQKVFFRSLADASRTIYKSYTFYLRVVAPAIQEACEIVPDLLKEYRKASEIYQRTLSASIIMQRAGEMGEVQNAVEKDAVAGQARVIGLPEVPVPEHEQRMALQDISCIAA